MQTPENQTPIDEPDLSAKETAAPEAGELIPETDEAQARIAELEAEVAELKDLFARARAETENQRRRSQEEVIAAGKYAIGKFAQELLPVRDCLEMALMDQSGNVEAMKMGVDMTLKQLAGAFEKVNLTEIAPVAGDRLDPHRHQAMTMEPADLEPNTLVPAMQKGYLLADRVLRPAMVIVAAPKA